MTAVSKEETIEVVNAYLNNFDLPLYTDLVVAAREVQRTELFLQSHPEKIAAQDRLRALLRKVPAAPVETSLA